MYGRPSVAAPPDAPEVELSSYYKPQFVKRCSCKVGRIEMID